VAGAATAATTHAAAKTPTTLSITESRTTIYPGQSDRIGGTLLTGTKPVAGKVVYLYDYSTSAHKWVSVAGEYTGSAGRVTFVVTPRHTISYELVYHGSSTLAGSHSGSATVLVVRQSTTLSATESAAVTAPDQSDVITGALLSGTVPVAGQSVRIYRYVASDHQWVLHDEATTSSAGTVAFTVTPGATDYYQLVFEGSSADGPSHSGVVTVVVTKLPTTLSIQEATSAITAGHQDVISGVLQNGPTAVAQHLVYLYRYSTSAKKWVAVAADLTNSSGQATFTVTPSSTSSYELQFHGSAGLYSSDSGVAVVTVVN
jgi:hypothetical protein